MWRVLSPDLGRTYILVHRGCRWKSLMGNAIRKCQTGSWAFISYNTRQSPLYIHFLYLAYLLYFSLSCSMDLWNLGDLVWSWRGREPFCSLDLTFVLWRYLHLERNLPRELNKMNNKQPQAFRTRTPESSGHSCLNQEIKTWGSFLLLSVPRLCSPTSLRRAAAPASAGWSPCDLNWHMDSLQLWLHMTFGPSPSINRLTQSLCLHM